MEAVGSHPGEEALQLDLERVGFCRGEVEGEQQEQVQGVQQVWAT